MIVQSFEKCVRKRKVQCELKMAASYHLLPSGRTTDYHKQS